MRTKTTHLNQKYVQEPRTLDEVKILVLGDGGVGKTSLLKRINGECFDNNESKTHGIHINNTDFEIPLNNKTLIIKTHFWDFGGQEVMHACHQFFLSKRSLYILVVDSRKDANIEYWLKHIETFGGNSPVMVVINKIDENPAFDLDRNVLIRKYKNIHGFFRVSCKNGVGIEEFKEALKHIIPQLEGFQTPIPTSWFNVKEKLETITLKSNYIDNHTFESICSQEGINDERVRMILIQFLSELGIILHFRELELSSFYVMNPRWITEAVYKIINSRYLAEHIGILDVDKLNYVMNEEITKTREYKLNLHDITYNASERNYILLLMENFELCYRLLNSNFLFPNLLEAKTPLFNIDEQDASRYKIQYDFLPKNIISRFIVRMHSDIKDNLLWRTGVILEDKDLQTNAVVLSDDNDRSILISVTGKQKRDYFSIIRKTIRNINASFSNLTFTELVPLPDHHDVLVEYHELIALEGMGETEITIGKLRKKYSISQLIDNIRSPEERYLSRNLSPIAMNATYSNEIEFQKRKIKHSERKRVLVLNSPESLNHQEFAKLYEHYNKAYQFENAKNFPKAIRSYNELLADNEYFLKAWEGLERIFNVLGKSDKRETALDYIRIISEIIRFETNANSKINLQHIQLHNLGFYGNFTWEFRPQINILLGKNGFGKSHLLRLMVSLLQEDNNIISDYFGGDKKGAYSKLYLERNKQNNLLERVKFEFNESIGKVPILAIPDIRFLDKSNTWISYKEDDKGDMREYGAYHFLYNKPYDMIIQNFLYELCIKYMNGGKSFDLPIFKLLHKVIRELVDTSFEFNQITPIGNAKFVIKVITEGNENNPLPLQYASQGTLSVLSLFGLIYEYLNILHQPEELLTEDVLKKPGIVFIDELDAHLHPSWQRKIIKLLRDNFPNVQFFITAHSPMVVAGCFEGEAAVLRKNENGFVVKNLFQDFIGYEAKELFQKIFEVEDKDDNYLYYMSLSPFIDEITTQISELEQKQQNETLTGDEINFLEKCYNDLYYIDKVQEKDKRRKMYSTLNIENHKLKLEIMELRNKLNNKE